MDSLRERLHESYALAHAGFSDATAARVVYRRDIRPHLPSDASGVDASPEQVRIARVGGSDRVELADLHACLRASPGEWDAILATDALAPGGIFIARAPNAASPFADRVMYGDITHEIWFTATAETGQLRGHIVTQNLTFAAHRDAAPRQGSNPHTAAAGNPP